MIPKIIHYCWFGKKPLPKPFADFVQGWKNLMPDYQLVCWNEENAPLHLPYLQNALAAENWANASNLVRLWAVYHHGGIYLDTDVEMKKAIDDFTSTSCFFGKEKDVERIYVNNAVFGAVAEHWFIKECIVALQMQYDGYEAANLSSPILTTTLLEKYEHINNDEIQDVRDIKLFPCEVFHPWSWFESKEKSQVDPSSFTIHHYAKTWEKRKPHSGFSIQKIIARLLPERMKTQLRFGQIYSQIQQQKKVMYGPFAGLSFAQLKAHGSSVFPKLIGSYESCLHPLWYELQLNKYQKIIHFGAGEGYYVMGLQKLLLPTEGSTAFECDPRNIVLLKQNLEANGMTAVVTIFDHKVNAVNAAANVEGKRCLIICDIEGEEMVIFHQQNINLFNRCDLVIELHEFLDRNVKEQLEQLFEATHDIEIIAEEKIPDVARKFLIHDRKARNWIQLMDEGRPEAMRWMVLRAKIL
ncbi:MAG: glycosyltransferase [Saprospiraceae bacterium]|nr:glycosyltransferase [Saprospiraceae bacterium]